MMFVSRHPEHVRNFAEGGRIFRCNLPGRVVVVPVAEWRDLWYQAEAIGAGVLVVGVGIGLLVGEWMRGGGRREAERERGSEDEKA